MTRLPTSVLCALAATLTFAAAACGGGDDSGDSGGSQSGTLDLAKDKAALTITFRPGDLQGGAPNSIASGDFNGDGKLDLLLGAPFADGSDATRNDAGEALVIYGPIAADRDLASQAPNVRILGATPGDMLGAGVVAGDLNDDGIDDIVVGAPGSNGIPEVRTDMGEVYVIFGRSDLPTVIDAREKQYDFLFQPAEGFSTLGKTFAIADVNNDGTMDLVAGAPYAGRAEGTPPGSPRTTNGEVYIVYGSSDLHGTATVVHNDEDVRLSGVNEYDQFGDSIAAADVNGDGIPDIVVGASGYDGPGGDVSEAGGVFVFYGGSLPKHKTLLEADMTITGADPDDTFGTQVAAVDANADGKAEILATSPAGGGPTNERFGSGEIAILDVSTFSGTDLGTLTSASGRRVFAPTDGELLSGALAVSSGDKPKMAVGSTIRTTPDRNGAGWAYLLPIRTDADLDLAGAGSDVLRIEGAAERQGMGGALAFADLDGDSKADLLAESADGVQQLGADPTFVGRLYVIRG